jgi:restriction endonuclease S subunit
MAIAEDIGYDATGKSTNNNELDFIGRELARFIESIESGKDGFFLGLDVDKDKIFLVNSKELEGRLDPFCYIPELVKLDKKVKAKTQYRLRHFSKYHSSGATPSKSEDTYYSDAENGIPFVRVQNLSVTGELDQTDLVYISREIHESLLKRSQIREGDLLVKITGVGRMAIASVVPQNFEGNINQHIVVIRTGSKEISENLAAFLNLDTVEKLASKRATGGTRPALDYPALFSIPVISDRRIYEKIQDAVAKKKQKELEAQQLLDSIDDYLLGELGIELPEPEENTIQNRIFIRNLSEVSGDRFDPSFYKPEHIFLFSTIKKLSHDKLGHIVKFSYEAWDQKSIFVEKFPYIEIGEINVSLGEIQNISMIEIEDAPSRARMIVRGGDILISTTRPNRGAIVKIDQGDNLFIASTGFAIIRQIINKNLNKDFLFYALRQSISLKQMEQRSSGGNYPAITQEELKNILIPLPPLEKQIEISEHITAIRNQAKQLQQQAKDDLEKAKQEVEAMILGDD